MSARREINVFISSTFSDMHEERDYLVNHVFPEIEKECRRRNVYFKALDLRWGITEEESKEGRVIEICMDQIKRSHPFFIGLVGGRYGWVPDDEKTLERVAEHYPSLLPYIGQGLSITEIEMLYGVLDSTEPVNAFFYLKNPKGLSTQYCEQSADRLNRLEDLRKRIRKASSEGKCLASNYDNIKQLGKLVRRQILDMVDRLYPEEKMPAMAEVQARQDYRLGMLRTAYCSYRAVNPAAYFTHINLVIVHGSPGTGSSALVANEVGDSPVIEDFEDGIKPVTVYTFIDNDVPDIEKLKRQFVYKLSLSFPHIVKDELNYPEDKPIPFNDIICRVPGYLLWIIDGPEHLKVESERTLSKLLNSSDAIDYMIVVTSDQTLAERIYDSTDRRALKFEVDPQSNLQLREIAAAWLAVYGKKLNERQMSAITASRIFRNLKQLRIFIEVLAKFGIYENVDSFIAGFVNVDTPLEFNLHLLEHLEGSYGRERVESLFTRLSLSEFGYPEELLYEEFRQSGLESAALSGLLDFMVSRRYGCLSLTDKDMREAVKARYILDDSVKVNMWHQVANYAHRESKAIMRNWSIKQTQSFIHALTSRGLLSEADAESALLKHYYRLAIIGAVRGNDPHLLNIILKNYGIPLVMEEEWHYQSEIVGFIRSSGLKTHKLITVSYMTLMHFSTNGTQEDKVYKFVYNVSDEKHKKLFIKRIKRLLIPKAWKKNILDYISKSSNREESYVTISDLGKILSPKELSMLDIERLKEAGGVALSYKKEKWFPMLIYKIDIKAQEADNVVLPPLLFLKAIIASSSGDSDILSAALKEIKNSGVDVSLGDRMIFLSMITEIIRHKTINEAAAEKAREFLCAQASLSLMHELKGITGKVDPEYLAEFIVAIYDGKLNDIVEEELKEATPDKLFTLRRIAYSLLNLGLYKNALILFEQLLDLVAESSEKVLIYEGMFEALLSLEDKARAYNLLSEFEEWIKAKRNDLSLEVEWKYLYFKTLIAQLKSEGNTVMIAREALDFSKKHQELKKLESAIELLADSLWIDAQYADDAKQLREESLRTSISFIKGIESEAVWVKLAEHLSDYEEIYNEVYIPWEEVIELGKKCLLKTYFPSIKFARLLAQICFRQDKLPDFHRMIYNRKDEFNASLLKAYSEIMDSDSFTFDDSEADYEDYDGSAAEGDEITALEELCYAYRVNGDYDKGLETFRLLNEKAIDNKDNYYEYIDALYPPVTALLAEDFEEFDKFCDEASYAENVTEDMLNLLRCVYLLKVDNFETEKILRAKIDLSGIDEDDENGDTLTALEAYRLLEKARYLIRKGEAAENVTKTLEECFEYLARIEGLYLYLHREAALTRDEWEDTTEHK